MTNSTGSFKEKLDFRSYKSSGDIEVPERIIVNQIIGQDEAVETVIKAAKQRRNVLLIGEPGIGKSMLAKGMAELLPPEELQDILVYPNMEDNHNPLIGAMPAGEGKKVVMTYRIKAKSKVKEEYVHDGYNWCNSGRWVFIKTVPGSYYSSRNSSTGNNADETQK